MLTSSDLGGLWLAPASGGVLLILFGVLIFVFPELLAFLVASVLIFAGVSLIGLAWSLRARVTYRRMDGRASGPFGPDDF